LQSVPVENMILCGPPKSFGQGCSTFFCLLYSPHGGKLGTDENFEQLASSEHIYPHLNQTYEIHEQIPLATSDNIVGSVESMSKSTF
jgi:hypothetical protein